MLYLSEEKLMFKDKLRELREDKGITQAEMAKMLNMTSTGYGAYERGDCEPSISTLINICKILCVSSDQLLELSKPDVFSQNDVEYLQSLTVKISQQLK